jgi:hypothetical protein
LLQSKLHIKLRREKVQADKWNKLQQKVGICQNLAGKLPDLEITVTTERGQPPLVVVNHIEKK